MRKLGASLSRLGQSATTPLGLPWQEYHSQIKELVEADLNNKEEAGAWQVLKYADGIQVSAYKPKYALNFSFSRVEFQIFLGYLSLLCIGFTGLNFLVAWELQASWLGFAIAFLNYSKLGKVFGIKSPDRVCIKARVVLPGTPEQLAQAFSETHCEADGFQSSPPTACHSGNSSSLEAANQRIQMQQFLLKLQSIDLSPFWLGLGRLLRKIQVTNRTAVTDTDKRRDTSSQILASGSSDMKHVAFKDDQANYFVLKRSKKDSSNLFDKQQMLADSSSQQVQTQKGEENYLAARGGRRMSKITSQELLKRTREQSSRSRSRSPMLERPVDQSVTEATRRRKQRPDALRKPQKLFDVKRNSKLFDSQIMEKGGYVEEDNIPTSTSPLQPFQKKPNLQSPRQQLIEQQTAKATATHEMPNKISEDAMKSLLPKENHREALVCLAASTNKLKMMNKVRAAGRRQSGRKEKIVFPTRTIRYRPPVLYDREQEEAEEETKLAALQPSIGSAAADSYNGEGGNGRALPNDSMLLAESNFSSSDGIIVQDENMNESQRSDFEVEAVESAVQPQQQQVKTVVYYFCELQRSSFELQQLKALTTTTASAKTK